MYINPELYIFEWLSSDEVSYFALMCDPLDFDPGQSIIREEDESDGRAYFVEEGEVVVSIEGKEVAKLGVGDIFGEIALITNDARTATVQAVGSVKVLALHRDDFLMLAKKSGKFPEIQKIIFERIKSNFERQI